MRKSKGIIETNSITDIHCHILPNIDDGAKDVEISVNMAQIALAEGINRIIATPHFDPDANNMEDFIAKRAEAISHLTDELKARGIEIDIFPGAEVYLTPSLLNLDGLENLCLGNSRYMLIEISIMAIPRWLDEILYSIQLRGITPILAHPERYINMVKSPKLLDELVEKGLLLQVNASSICDISDRKTKKFIHYLMKNDMVHFLATDAHSTGSRPPKIQESIRKLIDTYGSDTVEYMLENARKIGQG